jgi:hypothetical protein
LLVLRLMLMLLLILMLLKEVASRIGAIHLDFFAVYSDTAARVVFRTATTFSCNTVAIIRRSLRLRLMVPFEKDAHRQQFILY